VRLLCKANVMRYATPALIHANGSGPGTRPLVLHFSHYSQVPYLFCETHLCSAIIMLKVRLGVQVLSARHYNHRVQNMTTTCSIAALTGKVVVRSACEAAAAAAAVGRVPASVSTAMR
jgi:hypothetical protein